MAFYAQNVVATRPAHQAAPNQAVEQMDTEIHRYPEHRAVRDNSKKTRFEEDHGREA
jgi:hypothetical protein